FPVPGGNTFELILLMYCRPPGSSVMALTPPGVPGKAGGPTTAPAVVVWTDSAPMANTVSAAAIPGRARRRARATPAPKMRPMKSFGNRRMMYSPFRSSDELYGLGSFAIAILALSNWASLKQLERFAKSLHQKNSVISHFGKRYETRGNIPHDRVR